MTPWLCASCFQPSFRIFILQDRMGIGRVLSQISFLPYYLHVIVQTEYEENLRTQY